MSRYLLLPPFLMQTDASAPFVRANVLAGALHAILSTKEALGLRFREHLDPVSEHVRKDAQEFLDQRTDEHPVLVIFKDEGDWIATLLEHKLLDDGSLCVREDGEWHRATPEGSVQSVSFECPW